MALNKSVVPIPLGKLDKGRDTLTGGAGTLADAIDVCQDQDGLWRSRGKFTGMAQTIIGGYTTADARIVFGTGDNLAMRMATGEVVGYVKSLNTWKSAGFQPLSSLRSDILMSDRTMGAADTEVMDSVVANGQVWTVWSTETTNAQTLAGSKGNLYLSVFDLGTSADAVPGACLVENLDINALSISLTPVGGAGAVTVGGAASTLCLPHLTKCSRSSTDDTVVLTFQAQQAGSSANYLTAIAFPTATPGNNTSNLWAIKTSDGAWTAPLPYDVVEVADTAGVAGKTTPLVVATYMSGANYQTGVSDIYVGGMTSVLGTSSSANLGLHWLSKTTTQTSYITFAASGNGAANRLTGLWLNKIALPGLTVHSSTGAQIQVSATTTIQRFTGWSEPSSHDCVAWANISSKADGAGSTAVTMTLSRQTYNVASVAVVGVRYHVWPVSRAFNRGAVNVNNSWAYWVAYVGEDLPTSLGGWVASTKGSSNDQQQVYFCLHGNTSTLPGTSTRQTDQFRVLTKCHHDRAHVHRVSDYKAVDAFAATAWVTNVSQTRLAETSIRPVHALVLPKETELFSDTASSAVSSLPTFSAMALVTTDWDPQITDLGRGTSYGRSFILPGGIQEVYSGRSIQDAGHILRPEVPGLTVANTATGAVTSGTHSGCVCWISRDDDGNVWRSAPSPVNTVDCSAPNDTIYFHVQAPSLTSATTIGVEVYMTQVNGSVYYLAQSTSIPRSGALGGFSTLTITVDDTTLARAPTLYTDSGELPNDCTPTATIVTQWKNRLWAAGGEDRDAVHFSKELAEDTGVGWSSDFHLDIPDTYGDVTALAPFGDRLYIFKRRAIYAVAGDGPDATGAGWYSQPELVAERIGARTPRGVIVVPEGVMFASDDGIYMLDGGGRISEVGAPINADLRSIEGEGNGVHIAASAMIPNTSLVAFLPASDGGCAGYQGSTPLPRSSSQFIINSRNKTLYVWDRKRECWYTWGVEGNSYGKKGGTLASVGDTFYLQAPGVYAGIPSTTVAGALHSYAHAHVASIDTSGSSWPFVPALLTHWISVPTLGGFNRLQEIHVRGLTGATSSTTGYYATVLAEVEIDGVNGSQTPGTVYANYYEKEGTNVADHVVIRVQPEYQKCSRFRLGVALGPSRYNDQINAVNLSLCSVAVVLAGKGGLARVDVTSQAT
jgi:hypothetical protein